MDQEHTCWSLAVNSCQGILLAHIRTCWSSGLLGIFLHSLSRISLSERFRIINTLCRTLTLSKDSLWSYCYNTCDIVWIIDSILTSPYSITACNFFKGTTRGLSGVFLPLVMNPLCPLKYYDRWFAMANITPFYGKNRSGGSVMLLDPWMSP